ncbi:hypothetical protein ABLE92_09540 [Gordonia sp. VNQ95]|jgi:hypothetical protein|uniref:hypothetical protein n=1 Tax=Gordonia TaxID=2053 RepID=UPI0032B5D514
MMIDHADPPVHGGDHPTSSARSRDGGVSVVTTAEGLPLTVRIADARLSSPPQALADEILRLCRQSSMAAGIALRLQLAQSGTPADVLDSLGLPTPDDLAGQELRDDDDHGAPASWLRSV